MIDTLKAAAIAALNDELRHRGVFSSAKALIVMTCGIAALPARDMSAVIKAMIEFRDFSEDNDPHHEHDCAVFEAAGHRCIFKIDYYSDADMEAGAEDPLNCYRVLTLMLSSEY